MVFPKTSYFRSVITHDIGKNADCIKTIDLSKKRKVRQGLIAPELLKELCKKAGTNAEDIKTFLCHFELAFPLKDGNLFVPAIVTGKDEVSV